MTSPADDTTGATASRPVPWTRRWRLPLLLVATLIIMAVAQQLTVALNDSGAVDLVAGVALAAVTLFCYTRLSKLVERRQQVTELPRDRAISGLLGGSAIGAGAFLATMLVILVFGGWHVTGGDSWKFLATLGIMACVAVTEEVVFRGVLFRIAEERFGTWPALVVSAVLFGAVHLAGTSETGTGAMLWGATAIVLQGGILLTAAYIATRALWLPIGIHFAWNVVEAGFGTAVSGKSSEFGGLATTTLSGSPVLTGGSFGPEAGAAGILCCLVTSAFLLAFARRTGRIRGRGERPGTGAAQVG
ncbi:CPBP family intramembrane glutamic endopeptidase [Amycolatopsis sp. NPDC049252]|uniref:CPBP family intramembrane glutamic endopeptidase n=1 Tax=Amycolatopsis sp. NPDC049252 TaxID=3363933 RepID=UPI003721474B